MPRPARHERPQFGGFRTSHPSRAPERPGPGLESRRDIDRSSHHATAAASRSSQVWVAVAFVLTGIIWGSSFLFMKVALGGLSPAQVAWSRLVLGALALGLFVAHPPRVAPASSGGLGPHDGARDLVLRRAVPALLVGAAARDLGAREHLQRDDADHDGGDGRPAVPGREAQGRPDRRHRAGHPRRRRDHRAVAGPQSVAEPRRPVRDPRRDGVLRLQPRVHAQVRLGHGHERADVLVPQHRHRGRHHGAAHARSSSSRR